MKRYSFKVSGTVNPLSKTKEQIIEQVTVAIHKGIDDLKTVDITVEEIEN